MRKENAILQQKSQFLGQKFEETRGKLEETLGKVEKLQRFEPIFLKLQEKFPGISLEKVIENLEILQEKSLDFIKKINELEDEKREFSSKLARIERDSAANLGEITRKYQETARFLEESRRNRDKSPQNSEENGYKASYLQLFNRVAAVFNAFAHEIPVFAFQKDREMPRACLENPLEMLDLLEKLLAISSEKKIVAHLRGIIVQANVLQRKFFPENVNERFDAGKIYQRVAELVQTLRNQIVSQKTQINNLKVALEKEKSRLNSKCQEKIHGDSLEIAKETADGKKITRRNAFF